MDEIRVRQLTPDDLLDVHTLWKEAGLHFKPGGRDSLTSMGKELRETDSFLVGAFRGRSLVGVVLGTRDGRKGWVNRLAIRPEYQGKGIAKRLIEHCELVFKGKGIGIVSVLIEEENEASFELFRGAGYEECRDIVYFRKMLLEDW